MKATVEILEALARADEVFETGYARAEALCAYCPQGGEAWADRDRFEAIRRAAPSRLALGVLALVPIGLGHGSGVVHGDVRRLAWFVPAFLATSVREGEGFAQTMKTLADLVLEARDYAVGNESGIGFTLEEQSALAAFVIAALREALGVEGSGDDVAACVAVAHVATIDLSPIARAWLGAADRHATARAHLHAAVGGALGHGATPSPWSGRLSLVEEEALRQLLVREEVRAWLEAAFYRAAGKADVEAAELSRSEAAVAEALSEPSPDAS